MKRIVKGQEVIILEEDERGFASIEIQTLTKSMADLFSEESLLEIENDMPLNFRQMSMIAIIKSDIAGKDIMGYKKHRQALLDEGFDV